jgi:hypothetical protein
MKTVFLPAALAASLAVFGSASAQTGGSSSQTPTEATAPQSEWGEANSQASSHYNNVLTLNKMKQNLQKAGFTDIQILSDSFVVQAKDKDGNPTIMSLSPSGVFAISAIQGNEKRAKAGTAGSSNPGEAGLPGNKNGAAAYPPRYAENPGKTTGPADKTNVAPTKGPAAAGNPGEPGLPGNKNGPAVTPSGKSQQ